MLRGAVVRAIVAGAVYQLAHSEGTFVTAYNGVADFVGHCLSGAASLATGEVAAFSLPMGTGEIVHGYGVAVEAQEGAAAAAGIGQYALAFNGAGLVALGVVACVRGYQQG